MKVADGVSLKRIDCRTAPPMGVDAIHGLTRLA